MTATRRFRFEFAPLARGLLLPLGVTPATAYVDVSETELRVRFGFFSLDTPLVNVAGAQEEPGSGLRRSLGVRVSPADKSLTLGSSSARVRISFHDPVAGVLPRLEHSAVTVTVVNRAGLVAAIEDYEKRSNETG